MHFVAESDEHHLCRRRGAGQEASNLTDGDRRGSVERIAVDSTADGRKGERSQSVIAGEEQ
jgi:hypothetical protein